tara:strand:- start:1369 stop:2424 length:1056 start_codon:yes stop_codon:yes gene_type:complete
MVTELKEFTDKEIHEFTSFSKTYYNNIETTDYEYVKNKFTDYSNKHRSFHLKIKNDKDFLGRASLNERSLYIQNKKYIITQVTDLLVNKEYKDPMIFINLVKSYNKLNNDFVIHASNENSENIYKRFFKFKIIFNLTSYGFPIKFSKIIEKIFDKKIFVIKLIDIIYNFLLSILFFILSIFSSLKLDECSIKEFDIENRSKFINKNPNTMERDTYFLNWRFEKNPNEYFFKKILKGKNSYGFLIFRNTSHLELNVTLLMDILITENLNFFDYLKLRINIIKEAILSNNDIFFSIVNNNNKNLKKVFRFPIIPISDNLLQHGTPIFCSSIEKKLNIKNLKETHFTLADLDYF